MVPASSKALRAYR